MHRMPFVVESGIRCVMRSDAILSGRHMWLALFMKYSTVGSFWYFNAFGSLP